MANADSRIIASQDLTTAGFNDLADNWADNRRVERFSSYRIRDSFTEASALELANNEKVMITALDIGTHVSSVGDVGVISGQTPNNGYFYYNSGMNKLIRIAPLESEIAQRWAEGTLPGGSGTKSAKEYAEVARATADEVLAIDPGTLAEMQVIKATNEAAINTVITQAEQAAQSAVYAGGFATSEYASQSAGNAATTPGLIFRVPIGTTPQTFNWYRRLASGSELVSPLVSDALFHASVNYVTPEMYGAIGDATVSYDVGGVVIGYTGTDDTDALAAAFATAMESGAELRLSKWYRITSPLPWMTKPFAIVGAGRFNCGIVLDASMSGNAITISECWLGKDKDEITVGMDVRDPDQLYSGPKLEGFSIIGDRASSGNQHGVVCHRRVDKMRLYDVGAYHIKGCGLYIGYDDRPIINGTGGAKAWVRECDIQFEARWCGDQAGEYAAIRYWSLGWQTGDDANNNNVLDVEAFFSDGVGIHASGRSFNGASVRFDRWTRVMAELAGSDTVVIEGNVVQSKFSFIETNPTTLATYGIVLKEWSGNTSVSAGADRMPRNIEFTGVNGGRSGTSGVHAIECKNIHFLDYMPSTFRVVGGTDYHFVLDSAVSGVVALTGAASQGYASNISCDNVALQWLRVDPGRMESTASSIPPIKAAAHSLTYVPDAFPGNTPGMAFSTGGSWVIWPVSTRVFKSNDTAVSAGSAQNRVIDIQVAGTNTQSAQLKIGNTFDGSFYLRAATPTSAGAGTLPTLLVGSTLANNGTTGEAVGLSFTLRGHILANQGIKLAPPQYTNDEPSLLYRNVVGDMNVITYQPGGYTSRRGLGWRNGTPTAAGPTDAKGGWVTRNTNATLGGVTEWISLASDGSWVASGIVGGVQSAAQTDSAATDVAGLKADFNALLAKLRAARLMA